MASNIRTVGLTVDGREVASVQLSVDVQALLDLLGVVAVPAKLQRLHFQTSAVADSITGDRKRYDAAKLAKELGITLRSMCTVFKKNYQRVWKTPDGLDLQIQLSEIVEVLIQLEKQGYNTSLRRRAWLQQNNRLDKLLSGKHKELQSEVNQAFAA